MIFEPEIKLHDDPFKEGQFVVLAQVFFHYHKLKIAYGVSVRQTFVATEDVDLFIGHQLFYYFSEHQIHSGLDSESDSKINANDIVGNNVIYFVFARVGVVYRIEMHEPVDIGPLRLFIQDRIDDFVLDLAGVIGTGQIDQVCGIFGNGTVTAQLLYLGNVVLQS